MERRSSFFFLLSTHINFGNILDGQTTFFLDVIKIGFFLIQRLIFSGLFPIFYFKILNQFLNLPVQKLQFETLEMPYKNMTGCYKIG